MALMVQQDKVEAVNQIMAQVVVAAAIMAVAVVLSAVVAVAVHLTPTLLMQLLSLIPRDSAPAMGRLLLPGKLFLIGVVKIQIKGYSSE